MVWIDDWGTIYIYQMGSCIHSRKLDNHSGDKTHSRRCQGLFFWKPEKPPIQCRPQLFFFEPNDWMEWDLMYSNHIADMDETYETYETCETCV